jgi:colanic acid biosynthesis glycosyl transferase WcaI
MKVVVLNRYFHPDESATSRMVSSLAFGLAGRGWEVHAVSSRQLLGAPEAALPPRDEFGGVTIHRIWTSRFGRRSIIGRVLDYSTYYVSALGWMLRHARRSDLLIVATDPPLLSVLAWFAAMFTGAIRVNWLHDLYPEVAAGMGIAIPRAGYRVLQWLRDRSLRSAAMNVAIGERMASYVESRRVRRELISVIHNWSHGDQIRPVAPVDNALRQQWGFCDKFVVGYSGNMGRGHDFSTILKAAQLLQGEKDVAFVFIGAGQQLASIETQAKEMGLSNIALHPYQAPDRLSESLSVPDFHIVSLKPSLEAFMVPCKFYGVAAAGRPAIYIGDTTGEIPAILKAEDCGHAVPMGDAEGLAECILSLKRSPQHAARWAGNARNALEQRFDCRLAVGRWDAVLGRLVAPKSLGFPQPVKAEE